ncbi:MAG TPA: glycosyltransferase [Candidatus Bathyarchaeota archaeon]|nr:glycosyltransferase [Candidatus Bathyarchaeota archaeon]
MRIAVVHHSLNSCGGGERLCLNVLEALKARGHEVLLATTELTDWDRVERAFGRRFEPDGEFNLLPLRLRAFGIYQRMATGLLVGKLLKEADLVINTHGDMVAAPCHITYVHYPVFALLEQTRDVRVKYRKNIFWRFYFTPYQFLQTRLWRFYVSMTLVLTNSTFSRSVIRSKTGQDAIVIYPPVDLKAFRPGHKEPLVLTVGRFTWEKRLDLVPEIAKLVPEAHFVIAGSTAIGSREIIRRIEASGAPNVEVRPDVPFEELKRLYARAKVYLHPMVAEHFGISVVEGMASGCVPVVHASGGPWTDIIERGRYGFGFRSVEEAARAVRELVTNEELWAEFSRRALERSKAFSEEAFKGKFTRVVDAYLAKMAPS